MMKRFRKINQKRILCVSFAFFLLLFSACQKAEKQPEEKVPQTKAAAKTEEFSWHAIQLTEPSDQNNPMPPGREFYVNGTFHNNGPIPEGAVMSVYLCDKEYNVLEYVTQSIKNNNTYLIDPKLAEFNGVTEAELLKVAETVHMPELLYDGKDPASFNDPTLKCWFDDNWFKAVMQGVPEGEYYILAELLDREGHILAQGTDIVSVKLPDNALLARFHPDVHAAVMNAWSFENRYSLNYDYIPGFFPGVNGNSGAKTLNFIRSDCALYDGSHTRMFVYMIDPESSSYTIELPFLLSRGYVDDPKKFTAYYYDAGEAELSTEFQKVKGTITKFGSRDHHAICRVDLVNEKATENQFDLQDPCYDSFDIVADDGVIVPSGRRFAIMGVLSPQSLKDGLLQTVDTGLYSVNNRVENIVYTISGKDKVFEIVKPVFLKRTGVDESDENYGSVYEYYHIFDASSLEDGTWTFHMYGTDKNGEPVDGTEEDLVVTIKEEPAAKPVTAYVTSKDIDDSGNLMLPFGENVLPEKGYAYGDVLSVNIDGVCHDVLFVRNVTENAADGLILCKAGEGNGMVIACPGAAAAETLALAKSAEEDGENIWKLLNEKEKIQITIKAL